jgi:hypothetical protein
MNVYYTILHKTSTFTTWSTKQKNSWFFFSQKHRDILQEKTLLLLSQTKTILFVNSFDEKLLISIFFYWHVWHDWKSPQNNLFQVSDTTGLYDPLVFLHSNKKDIFLLKHNLNKCLECFLIKQWKKYHLIDYTASLYLFKLASLYHNVFQIDIHIIMIQNKYNFHRWFLRKLLVGRKHHCGINVLGWKVWFIGQKFKQNFFQVSDTTGLYDPLVFLHSNKKDIFLLKQKILFKLLPDESYLSP